MYFFNTICFHTISCVDFILASAKICAKNCATVFKVTNILYPLLKIFLVNYDTSMDAYMHTQNDLTYIDNYFRVV